MVGTRTYSDLYKTGEDNNHVHGQSFFMVLSTALMNRTVHLFFNHGTIQNSTSIAVTQMPFYYLYQIPCQIHDDVVKQKLYVAS